LSIDKQEDYKIEKRILYPILSFARIESCLYTTGIDLSAQAQSMYDKLFFLSEVLKSNPKTEISIPSHWLEIDEFDEFKTKLYPYQKRIYFQISTGAELEGNNKKCAELLRDGWQIEILADRALSFREQKTVKEWHENNWAFEIVFILNRESNPLEELEQLRFFSKKKIKLVFLSKQSEYDSFLSQKEVYLYSNWIKDYLNNNLEQVAILQYSQFGINKNMIPISQIPALRRSVGSSWVKLIKKINIFYFFEEIIDFAVNPTFRQFKTSLQQLIIKTYRTIIIVLEFAYYNVPHKIYHTLKVILIKLAFSLRHMSVMTSLRLFHESKLFVIDAYFKMRHMSVMTCIRLFYALKVVSIRLFFRIHGSSKIFIIKTYFRLRHLSVMTSLRLFHESKLLLIANFFKLRHFLVMTFLFLFYPLRKLCWFLSYQYKTRIMRR
jgi:hypothetical protein